ncbi:MAG: hypothetical protein J5626_02445 [Lachnospiraceae bacterium]|nr:hypothetical protein [Lachnospiraceae bacterium]
MQKLMMAIMPVVLTVVLTFTSIVPLGVGKSVTSDMSISGTTATCSVSVRPEKSTDKVELSVQLVCGSEVVAEWNSVTGTGTLRFSKTASVKKGKTYTMKTTCKINGTSYPIGNITKKCK